MDPAKRTDGREAVAHSQDVSLCGAVPTYSVYFFSHSQYLPAFLQVVPVQVDLIRPPLVVGNGSRVQSGIGVEPRPD